MSNPISGLAEGAIRGLYLYIDPDSELQEFIEQK